MRLYFRLASNISGIEPRHPPRYRAYLSMAAQKEPYPPGQNSAVPLRILPAVLEGKGIVHCNGVWPSPCQAGFPGRETVCPMALPGPQGTPAGPFPRGAGRHRSVDRRTFPRTSRLVLTARGSHSLHSAGILPAKWPGKDATAKPGMAVHEPAGSAPPVRRSGWPEESLPGKSGSGRHCRLRGPV